MLPDAPAPIAVGPEILPGEAGPEITEALSLLVPPVPQAFLATTDIVPEPGVAAPVIVI